MTFMMLFSWKSLDSVISFSFLLSIVLHMMNEFVFMTRFGQQQSGRGSNADRMVIDLTSDAEGELYFFSATTFGLLRLVMAMKTTKSVYRMMKNLTMDYGGKPGVEMETKDTDVDGSPAMACWLVKHTYCGI